MLFISNGRSFLVLGRIAKTGRWAQTYEKNLRNGWRSAFLASCLFHPLFSPVRTLLSQFPGVTCLQDSSEKNTEPAIEGFGRTAFSISLREQGPNFQSGDTRYSSRNSTSKLSRKRAEALKLACPLSLSYFQESSASRQNQAPL